MSALTLKTEVTKQGVTEHDRKSQAVCDEVAR